MPRIQNGQDRDTYHEHLFIVNSRHQFRQVFVLTLAPLSLFVALMILSPSELATSCFVLARQARIPSMTRLCCDAEARFGSEQLLVNRIRSIAARLLWSAIDPIQLPRNAMGIENNAGAS